jgi:ABC-type amino acid transport system permease subunit
MLIAKKFQQKEAALSLAHEKIMASTQVVLDDVLERVPPDYKNGFLAGCKYTELMKSKLS